MKKYILTLGLGLTLALIACQPKVTESVNEVKDSTKSAEVAQGEELFNNNCGKCHKLFKPSDFSAEKWQKVIPPMAQKAKLDATQESKIYQYVMWSLNN